MLQKAAFLRRSRVLKTEAYPVTTSDVRAELERFKRDTAYYREHWEELLDQYPERWAAIVNERVVGSAPDLRELLDEIRMKGIPPGQALVEYVTRENYDLILAV